MIIVFNVVQSKQRVARNDSVTTAKSRTRIQARAVMTITAFGKPCSLLPQGFSVCSAVWRGSSQLTKSWTCFITSFGKKRSRRSMLCFFTATTSFVNVPFAME